MLSYVATKPDLPWAELKDVSMSRRVLEENEILTLSEQDWKGNNREWLKGIWDQSAQWMRTSLSIHDSTGNFLLLVLVGVCFKLYFCIIELLICLVP
jgi:hypothetical protein